MTLGPVTRRASRALAWVCLGGPLGCFGTPTPLAPGLSGSIGYPHHGVQTGAVELPESGEGFCRFRRHGAQHFGQPALVEGLIEAARHVFRAMPGGAPLVVGDLSAREGGKIERHASHRTGRDVDLLWYVTTPEGAPVQNPAFARVESDGLAELWSGHYVRLDVPRQWLLIETLLSSRHFEVQWLYASETVEALLIDHALARGADPEVVRRAQTVMHEPVDSLPHDDHLHVRIACTPENSSRGCEGGGPHWSWLSPQPSLEAGDTDELGLLLLGEAGG